MARLRGRPTPAPADIAVEQRHRGGLTLAAGTHTLRYAVRNPGGGPLRVVGASAPCEECNENCRFRLALELPFDLPAGAEQFFECELVVPKPGHFAAEFTIYLAADRAVALTLGVEGEAATTPP